MKQIQLLVILFLLFSCKPISEKHPSSDLSEIDPGEVGMSAERLSRIDSVLNEYISNEWIPGAVALVARKGHIVYKKSFGYKQIDSNEKLQTDDIFRIASQTKAITSVALMMLFEKGAFLLDDPVYKYIPEFKDPVILTDMDIETGDYTTRPASKQITIRQLLTHTSGIGYGFLNPRQKYFYDKEGIPDGFVVSDAVLGDKIKLLARQPLLFEPGEKWMYGLNTDVVGYLVEVLSGKPLDVYFKEKIFEPLGMKDSYFYLPSDKTDRLVPIYSGGDEGLKLSDISDFNYPIEGGKSYFSGGAGISATGLDYMKFMQMLLNNGEFNNTRLLGRKTIELMTTNQIGDLRIWGGYQFGLGFSLISEENKHLTLNSPGNYSWGGYFSTSYWLDPEEEIIATLMTQMDPNVHGEIHNKFHVMVYQALID